ncbi:nucleotidyltransferase family protein [Paraglaciecola chathamensis]|uniref:Alcohol dehydrogenase n=1 Tax=Paraglaciecola chathamensis TaxID=368405 RepID=A0A8H9I947_9ALTE|nr:nucleotidyltransferase family protein [Paraglaciecola oceanifecundans]AEE22081.1 Nucleotidyl transferase [Glaciecola sp. 4H-3-7+YE-5]GGZ57484.1 alcohol dehydrogenase [Paraglaciecola oceanifecundans]
MSNTFVLKCDSTFEMAVEAIDKGGLGFIAVVNTEMLLLGILTDGDIRRAFLKKSFNLDTIINKNPEVMNYKSSKESIISRLKALHRRHMPLIDEEGLYKGVFSFDDIEFITRDNAVVIMAGGLGSRLGELTKNTPKPMLEVGNQPMLQHLVELFREQGFCKFIFCVNYKKDVIQKYFKDGADFGVKIAYVEEEVRMGTAGALSLINQDLTSPFFVINADILTNLDFVSLLNYHEKMEAPATMCVRQYQIQIPYGVISSKGGQLKSIEEKPNFTFDVNAGIYLLCPSVRKFIPKNEFFDMPSLFERLMTEGLVPGTFEVNDYWIDIGKREDLLQANADMQHLK